MNLTRYQWIVLLAAWLGWGFDVYDGLLFNFVAPNALPALLHLPAGSPAANSATLFWTGVLTSLLLVGWAAGGVLFGYLADRIGRARTLMLTMLLYSAGTAACAFAPNLAVLVFFRLIAALGIGGEWAAGAAIVSEVMPEKYRVQTGSILFTAAPMGFFLASFVNQEIAGQWFAASPELSWRYVMLCGLIPAVVVVLVRLAVKEPERWLHARQSTSPPTLAGLLAPELRRPLLTGFLMVTIPLLAWWSCNAFLPIISSASAQAEAMRLGLHGLDAQKLIEQWKAQASYAFSIGGVVGAVLMIPLAEKFGRLKTFGLYYVASAAAIMVAYGVPLPHDMQVRMYFAVGVSLYGIFAGFIYYLPELFPTRLRGSGSGFCYNAGRLIAAFGPIVVGTIASQGHRAGDTASQFLFWVGFVPLAALLVLPFAIETRGRPLPE